MGIGETGQITLTEDRGAKSWLRKNHHAGCALDQVSAGARPDHQKKSIWHPSVQPDDRCKTAEHFPRS